MELVVGASEATMKSLLGKLGGLLAQEYTLIHGVRGDIQYITDELATMLAFLGDLGSTQEDHDRRIKNWMKQIRDMAYDMEDCIDDFAHRLPNDPLSDRTCSFIVTRIYELWTFWPRRQIASKIAELKVRAQQIAERRGRYGVDNPAKKHGSSSGAGATHAVTYGIAEHLMANRQLIHTLKPIGVEEDMEKLRPWLTKESHRAVISIVGFGGVGKTTIATKLYQDFGNEFDCRALVTVSQNYDEDQVLRDILRQIKPRDRQQEQQDHNHNTGRPAEKNLAAGTKAGLVKRLVPLLSGRREQGNDGSTQQANNNIVTRDQPIEEKPRDSKQEQQDSSTGRPAEKNLAAATKAGLVKRLVPLLCGRREQVNDGSTHQQATNNIDQVKPRDSKQEQHVHNTGTPAEKNLAAGIKPGLAKCLVPLFREHSKQGNDGGTQGTQSKIENMTRDQLIKELQSRLQGKRYILLIDDIWSVETWENIRNWLPLEKDSKGSKVIVTSRFTAVGAACSERDGTDCLHTVKALSDDMSESLFKHGVSESQRSKQSVSVNAGSQAAGTECSKGEGTDNPHSADICSDATANEPLTDHVSDPQSSNSRKKEKVHDEEIWKYCGGLPLAIVTMAGLVACNPTKKNDHWSTVCKSLFPEQVSPLTLDGVTRILEYCYNDLPADLKTCSLYLSIFPKGSKISKKRLTRRWISECFVTEKQGLSAEEVAETYFNQLISRKIIRPEDHSSNGKVKSFKVHDMILEYIVSKSSEENFITVVGGHWLMPTPSNKVRRLSMQSSGPKDGNSTKGMNLSQVRSLTVFGSQNRRVPFHSFNNGIIQVLDLEGWKGMKDKYMNDICKMLVLKYLGLRRTEVVHIPSKIGKLEHLETLDIRETRVEELPKAFGQLKRLRSMLGGSKNPKKKALKMPNEKNKEPMKALRILSGIEINKDSTAVASLHQLTGLRKLAIYKLNIQKGDQIFKQLLSSIEYLSSCGLQTLAINDEGSDFINSLDSMSTPPRYLVGLELSGKMEKPPKWIEDLNNLYKLTLSVTVLRTDTFQLIKNLPKLFSLTFTLTAGKDDRDIVDILEENKLLTDREIIVPPGGFESLKLLRFFATLVPRLSFAVTVTEEDVMPALERIDMRFQAFEGIYGIETLKSLQELHLSVGNQADEVTKFLVEELKDNANRNYLDEKYATKWPKIISD